MEGVAGLSVGLVGCVKLKPQQPGNARLFWITGPTSNFPGVCWRLHPGCAFWTVAESIYPH